MYPLWTSLCLPLEHWMNWIKGLSVVVETRLECEKVDGLKRRRM